DAVSVTNLAPLEDVASAESRFEGFHRNFLIYANRPQEIDVHLCGDSPGVAKAADLAHRFIEQHCDDSSVQISSASLITRAQHELADYAAIGIVLIERQLHSSIVRAAATEAAVLGIGIECDGVCQTRSCLAFVVRPVRHGYAPRGEHRVAACAF